MSSLIFSSRDLEFLLYEWLGVESLTSRTRFEMHSRETFDAVLQLAEEIAERHFAPHNTVGDREEPRLDDGRVRIIPEVCAALRSFHKSGMLAGAMDESVGGVQLPRVVCSAAFEWIQAANIATANYAMLTMANANLLRAYGTADQVRTFVLPMIEGRFFGTMCLSEPEVGSSLADVSTKATKDVREDNFRLTGKKMWISGGEHELSENIVHLVLARTTSAPPGVRGLSLFIVPKFLVNSDGTLGERNDVVLAGVNHKMGNRGTVNTFLSFGEGGFEPLGAPGAVGYLVGKEDHGLQYMFHMMNEARIAVGAAAVALGYTGYLHACDYARSRTQGRLPGAKDPSSAPVQIIEHADVRRMLLASKSYVEGGLALVLYCSRLLDEAETAISEEDRDRARVLLDVLTPIAKSWPSQWCLAANDHAIQILGGYGYSNEHPVEQYYRDNRLNMIHEGTNGIQALDLLGRKVTRDDGNGLRTLVDSIGATLTRSRLDYADYATQLGHALSRLVEVTESLWAQGDERKALGHASLYLDVVGHVVVAWMWLEQLLAVGEHIGPFYEGKRATARYFFDYELPLVQPKLDRLASGDTWFLEFDNAWF